MSTKITLTELPLPFPGYTPGTIGKSELLSSEEAADGIWSVKVASSVQMLEELRSFWERWTHSLETDLDYYLHRLKNDSSILSPYVITVWQGGELEAMLVGQVRKWRPSATVCFVNIRGPEGTALEVVNGGRIGRKSDAIDRLLALSLLRAAKARGVDLLLLERLPLHSELFRELRRLKGRIMKPRVPNIVRYSMLPLTATAGKRVPVFSGKNRREVRRKTRILERAFPDEVRFRCFSRPEELDLGMRDAGAISVMTWQNYLGQESLNDLPTKSNLAFFARRGWLRIYVIYIADVPCAFLIGQLYKRTFYCQHAGYNPDFACFSVGSLLNAWALENLAAAGVRIVDLGEGRQEHSRRLGCFAREEGTVHLYSSTLRGLSLNLFFAATHTLRVVGRKTLTELRLNRASKAWSHFLVSQWKTKKRMGDLCP